MAEINLQPVLIGKTLMLRPLLASDFDTLYRVASDPALWETHPDSQRFQRDIFQQRYFQGALDSGGALLMEMRSSGRVIGCSRFYRWDAVSRSISIGYTFIDREHWGDGSNSEVKWLMLDYIFQWSDTVWFHVGENNLRSRRAVEKLGATLSHEEARELDGTPYTQLYYKLDKDDLRRV